MTADSLVHLSHVNIDPEQNCCDHIAYCLDNQYHTFHYHLSKVQKTGIDSLKTLGITTKMV